MLTSYSCIGNRVRSVIRDPATAALIKIPNITMMLEAHCTFRNNLLKLPTKYGNILDKPMIVPASKIIFQ